MPCLEKHLCAAPSYTRKNCPKFYVEDMTIYSMLWIVQKKLFSGLHTLITNAHYYHHSPHKVEQCHLEHTLALLDQDSQQLQEHFFYTESSEQLAMKCRM